MTEEIKKDLRDAAYTIATGSHLTAKFTYDEFQAIDIEDYKWQMVEYWPVDVLESHIADLAETIYHSLIEQREEEP